MFLFFVLLCCVLQPILHYYCVFGKRESLQRFVVEDGAKPAIFGSYSYDPVRQVFVPPPPDPNAGNGTTKGLLDSTTDPKTDLQADLPTGTQSDIQTEVHGNTLPHQLTSTPSVTIPDQSLKDSFISTAGDTGTDTPDGENQILRKHERR